MVNWIDEPKPLDIGSVVTHRNFGDGKIDQRRERGGETFFHVHFAKVSAWFLPRDLKPIADDEPDAQAVAHLEAAYEERTDYAGA